MELPNRHSQIKIKNNAIKISIDKRRAQIASLKLYRTLNNRLQKQDKERSYRVQPEAERALNRFHKLYPLLKSIHHSWLQLWSYTSSYPEPTARYAGNLPVWHLRLQC